MFKCNPQLSHPAPAGVVAPLRILHLEDRQEDVELVQAILERDGLNCQTVWAPGKEPFENALARENFDLVFADYTLPDYDGLTALQLVQAKCPFTPFILVSGSLGEERAVESLKCGATDYILKTRLLRLPAAVRRAVSDATMHYQYRLVEEKLQQNQDWFRQITESMEDLVAVLDLEGKRVFSSPSYHRLLGEPACGNGVDSFREIHPDDREYIRKIFADSVASGTGRRAEYRFVLPDGAVRNIESQGSVIRNLEGQITNILVVSRDITERKGSETRLAEAHKELVSLSRQAGLAEVATGVLHDVGNVLNSVNVATQCLADDLRKSKAISLAKVVSLLREHEANLADFFAQDPKGKQLPCYLANLSEQLIAEQTRALAELAHLQGNIEHIKTIVSIQQRFALVSGLAEPVQLTDLLEDALLMNASSLGKHDIRVVKEFTLVPPVAVPKHAVLQILVNLIRNARHACDDSARDEKQMTLRLMKGPDRVRISVTDNGVGISPDNLPRVFTRGFTTRKYGHGFGLHSGALAAREMGGDLNVHSDGVGRGATFTLELPCL